MTFRIKARHERVVIREGQRWEHWDERSCPRSIPRHPLEMREVEAGVHWLQNRSGFPDDPRVVLFGWSMGGAVASHVMAMSAKLGSRHATTRAMFSGVPRKRASIIASAGSRKSIE